MTIKMVRSENNGIQNPVKSEFIPCEVFLELTGYFTPSSNRIRNCFTKEKTIKLPSGESSAVSIHAIQTLGLPVTFDQDLYRAFLKICDELVHESGRLPEAIEVPTKKLLRYARKDASATSRRRAKEWFEIMHGTQIRGLIYHHGQQTFERRLTTVFAEVVMRGEVLDGSDVAKTNYVWLSPWFRENLEARFVRPFDLAFYQSLGKNVSKVLHSLLETGWYATGGKPFTKSYTALCDEFLLVRNRSLSKIKQQLDPAHDELRRSGFLKTWEYEQAKGGGIKISYHPGNKFFSDQTVRLRAKKRAGMAASPTDAAITQRARDHRAGEITALKEQVFESMTNPFCDR